MAWSPRRRPTQVASPRVLDGSPCIVCGNPVRARIATWSARCPQCGSWLSDLPVGGAEVESETRVAGYEQLRRANARLVLDRVGVFKSLDGARLLDIGSAYGWFLEEAAARGASPVGIEPDAQVASHARHQTLVGRFPDVLDAGEGFDVIAFNDVLEHIPDLPGALDACVRHLRPGGLLSVNIPTADGLAFRAACVLARAGITGPYRRLWQQGLASPHLHYLTTRGLEDVIRKSQLTIRAKNALPGITREGLWARVHTVRRTSPASAIGFGALYAAAGVLNMPGASDIVHVIAERTA
jgi:SAM-dependent methyltransferase